MHPAECRYSTSNSLSGMLHIRRRTEALIGYGGDDRQRVFHAVMQFFQDKALEFVGNVVLCCIKPCLQQQLPQIGIFQL